MLIDKIGNIPLEEYCWILFDTLFTYFFTLRLWTEFYNPNKRFIENPTTFHRNIGLGLLFVLSILGIGMLILGEPTYMFLGICLGFFCPFIAWQWAASGYIIFLRYPHIWLSSWLIPGLFTYVLDSIAVNQAIWVFDYSFTMQYWVFGLVNVEVCLIYVIACIVCAQPALRMVGYLEELDESYIKEKKN